MTACAPGVVTHNNTGNERFAEGAYDEAIAEYRQAQVDDPDRAEPYYNAANAFNRQGEITPTLALAQQALKTAGADLSAQTWYNLGNAYFDAEQWADAVAAYQEALRLDPDDLDAKHNLELALQKLKEQEQQQQQQEQEGQSSENEKQSEAGQPTPTPASEQAGESANQPDNEATPQPAGQAQESEGMTPEQALQLLQAIVGDSQTLQERLQEIYRVPGPPPEEDW